MIFLLGNFNIWQLQILRAEAKNQGSRTNMGQKDSTALTGIAHLISISTFFQLLRCANIFYFSLGNFIFNIVVPAIFITQLAHSCFPFSFVVEALSAKVISHRTGRSADRPTATGLRTALPRPGPRAAAGGRSATAADPARAQPAGGRS